jgi:hypothetical protein
VRRTTLRALEEIDALGREELAVEASSDESVDSLAAPHLFGVADYAINQSCCALRADLVCQYAPWRPIRVSRPHHSLAPSHHLKCPLSWVTSPYESTNA